MSNSPKSVVVTGASTGIGRAIAAKLSDQGFQVFARVRNERDAIILQQFGLSRATTIR